MAKKARNLLYLMLLGLYWSTYALAQQKINCPDNTRRISIDLKQLQIQYSASSFAGTLASLGALHAHLSLEQKILQQASAATQQWNEFLKGLVAGYNSCAINNQQYADLLKRIYPRLKQDAAGLEEIRKIVSEGGKADEKRLKTLLDRYFVNLRQFAKISGNEIIIERITAVVEKGTDRVLERLDELERNLKQTSIATPAQVKKEVSTIREKLRLKADEAQAAYDKGYDLYQRYRFAEAIGFFKEALQIIQLQEFYLALGTAYFALPDLGEAENAYTKGLRQSVANKDEKIEATFSNQLGQVLHDKGDLDGALRYARRALTISEKVYGPYDPNVAHDANTIGRILQAKGDLDEALRYTRRALTINEKVYGPNHPTVAVYANNLGQVLKETGDLDGALRYTQRAFTIGEKVFGPDHPTVAIRATNIGAILKDKGDLDGALRYTERAFKIDEEVFGPDHPNVARDLNNLSQILHDKGNLDDALRLTERALKIAEKFFGWDHPNVAIASNNIGQILKEKGDLNEALRYTRRALTINEKVYGPNHSTVAVYANNLGQILKEKGDLDEALRFTERALKIDERVFGLNHPNVASTSNNIGHILKLKGDLDNALRHSERALKIHEKTFGPDHPSVAIDIDTIGQILMTKGDLDGAVRYTERALKILEKNYGAHNPKTQIIAGNLRHIKNQRENPPKN